MVYYGGNDYRDYLAHYGVKGMKWGKHLFRMFDTNLINNIAMTNPTTSGPAMNSKTRKAINNKRVAAELRRGSNTGGVYSTRWRRANLLNVKNIGPGGSSKSTNGSYSSNDPYHRAWQDHNYEEYNQRTNYRRAYITKKHANSIADKLEQNVRDAFAHKKAKNTVLSKAYEKISSFAEPIVNKGKRVLSKLFGLNFKYRTYPNRPHSRKKKRARGRAEVERI